jgi:hypothetical protein
LARPADEQVQCEAVTGNPLPNMATPESGARADGAEAPAFELPKDDECLKLETDENLAEHERTQLEMEKATSADSERSQCEENGAQEESIERVGNTAAPTACTGFTSELQLLHSGTPLVLQHLAEMTDFSGKQAPVLSFNANQRRLNGHYVLQLDDGTKAAPRPERCTAWVTDEKENAAVDERLSQHQPEKIDDRAEGEQLQCQVAQNGTRAEWAAFFAPNWLAVTPASGTAPADKANASGSETSATAPVLVVDSSESGEQPVTKKAKTSAEVLYGVKWRPNVPVTRNHAVAHDDETAWIAHWKGSQSYHPSSEVRFLYLPGAGVQIEGVEEAKSEQHLVKTEELRNGRARVGSHPETHDLAGCSSPRVAQRRSARVSGSPPHKRKCLEDRTCAVCLKRDVNTTPHPHLEQLGMKVSYGFALAPELHRVCMGFASIQWSGIICCRLATSVITYSTCPKAYQRQVRCTSLGE